METQLESLMVRLMGDGSSYQRMLAQAAKSTSSFTDALQFQSHKIHGFGLRLRGFGETALGTAAGYASVLGIGASVNAAQGAVSRFMEAEKTEIAFEALIGNAELAQKTLKDLRQFAAETPFESPEIMAAAKQMIAFGESAENIVPTMKNLGDVSAGLNIPLGQLTYLFGTLKAQGRAMTVDINQFAMRGIPIWKELEKITGKSNAELRKMVEEGKVGFPLVEQAFQNMTKEGGLFHGQLEKQSKSLSGLVSTLKDNVGMVLADVGKKLVETFDIKGLIKDLGDAAFEAGRWITFMADEAVNVGRAVREWAGTTGVQWLRDTAKAAQEWVAANQKLVLGIGLTAGAVGLAVVAFKVLQFSLLTTLAAMTMLGVQKAIGAGLWLAYKAAMLVASAASLGFQLATWGLNASLMVLNFELLIPIAVGLAFAASAAGALALVFAGLAAAGYAVYKGVSAGLDVIMAIPTGEGPVKVITELFGGWVTNLKRIAEIAKKDLPAAFELLKMQAEIAITQIEAMWPPLARFILSVSNTVWKEIKHESTLAFSEALRIMFKEAGVFFKEIKDNFKIAMNPLQTGMELGKSMTESTKKMDKEMSKNMQFGKHWSLEIKDAVKRFEEEMKATGRSGTIADLTKRITDAIDAVELDQWIDNFWGDAGETAAERAKREAEAAGLAVKMKIIPTFDAAEWGSAEMHSRVAEWRDRMNIHASGRAPKSEFERSIPVVGSGGLASDHKDEAGSRNLIDIFKQIEENTRGSVVVTPAGLGGGDFGGGDF